MALRPIIDRDPGTGQKKSPQRLLTVAANIPNEKKTYTLENLKALADTRLRSQPVSSVVLGSQQAGLAIRPAENITSREVTPPETTKIKGLRLFPNYDLYLDGVRYKDVPRGIKILVERAALHLANKGIGKSGWAFKSSMLDFFKEIYVVLYAPITMLVSWLRQQLRTLIPILKVTARPMLELSLFSTATPYKLSLTKLENHWQLTVHSDEESIFKDGFLTTWCQASPLERLGEMGDKGVIVGQDNPQFLPELGVNQRLHIVVAPTDSLV
ncbi:hypothetical protein A2291_04660 [candidate division WOR-1 bacterium RIFOXYB2_FULL_42_35]|uniref:Uncharacterized protein n=1 Tax=candidate division WOR-1 bacterium RIFOXYC2_FULL_41_25 TaxID=1802586 RepID=A0A1F4TLT4_UNCSA|nr:MAG: hypothetical protein A2247_07285 [candidate division WOR-1 bacterium RIFOXYA2_FULL_41_14]OGC22185.1 MAG: hypothetical protein A2291_04660 [candidate division WOR-1 bacterium RIFOXYB2_FULL_42_35]OGC33519.1 MAG: hypothetical protein A2462_08900 [candidate division WOR-1 bacterium RIFOXYC2_FULL_41_25]OGC43204.1 MAG: hypothetical protein A2548_01880 [candidate division WOR-1 bacterium RIFOXYD2_FULL_41_8]